MQALHVRLVGSGLPTLVLLHGLGAHGGLWDEVVARLRARFNGTIIAPDLRGHGRSPHATHYGYGLYAADVADRLPAEGSVYVAGHSMGGVIALALASGLYGLQPDAAFVFSMKTDFAPDELRRLSASASSPVKSFGSAQEAAARFVKVAGLEGLLAADSDQALSGIRQQGDEYRLAADPRTVLAAGPSVHAMLRASRCPVRFACGQHDTIASIEQTRALDPDAIEIPDAGHNPHVEHPQILAELLLEWIGAQPPR